MRHQLFILPFIACAVACAGLDDAEYAEIHELATEGADVISSVVGDEIIVKIYSNGHVDITPLNDLGDWCKVNKTSIDGDEDISVIFAANEGSRRMAKLRLCLDNGIKSDTIFVKQDGEVAFLECAAPYKNVNGSLGGIVEYELSTNVDASLLNKDVEYLSKETGWITSITPETNKLYVQTAANSTENTIKARISVNFIDGWDEKLNLDLFVTESNKNGHFGKKISFQEARELAGKGEITDDIYIEGVAVSDFHSMNMEENPSVNYDKVDTDENLRTAYIQSLDGTMGFRLKFDSPQNNILAYNTKVEISLTGLTIEKETDPQRYTIYDVGGENMVNSTSGEFIVEKRRNIADLCDDDLYTFVTLSNTEFIQKVGSYANVYENYTLKSALNEHLSGNNNRLDGWATLLNDNSGHAIYAPINMLCLWRRSGKGVPQGVGDTKGIIVNNTLKRYGDVGKYQIRVLDESGFCQDWTGESYYKLFAKWDGDPFQYRYSQWAKEDPKYADPGTPEARVDAPVPSDDLASGHSPAANITIENKAWASAFPISYYYSITGLTVSDAGCDRGFDPVRKSMCLQYEIKGWFKWDENNKVCGYNGLCIDFATNEITGTEMLLEYSFHVGKISAATSQYFPAHWCTEYSLDGGKTYKLCKDIVTGKDYVHLRTLPWWDATIASVKYFTSSSCGLGATQHAVVLPSEIFDRENVRVRIRPYDNVMAVFPINWNDDTETGEVLSNTTVTTTTIQFETIYLSYK